MTNRHVLLAVLLVGGMLAWAITFWPAYSPAQSGGCRRMIVNRLGVARADIVVSNTAIAVMPSNTSRCAAILFNSSLNDIRCRDTADGAPTATVGLLIPGGQGRTMDLEGQNAWNCIRVGANDGTLNVGEALP
jgi:hypothetical protein